MKSKLKKELALKKIEMNMKQKISSGYQKKQDGVI